MLGNSIISLESDLGSYIISTYDTPIGDCHREYLERERVHRSIALFYEVISIDQKWLL